MASNVCYSFQSSGSCKFGSQCRYSHGEDGGAQQGGSGGFSSGGGGGYRSAPRSGPAGPCYSFQESGSCKFGNQCRYTHGDEPTSGSAGGGGAPSRYNTGDRYSSGPRSFGSSFGGQRSGGAGPCYEFRDTGVCKFGDQCRFNHGAASSGGGGGDGGGDRYESRRERPNGGVCYQFKNAGNCTYGEQCRFSHDLSGASSGATEEIAM